jgi:uncharacterized protein (DUF305 family)
MNPRKLLTVELAVVTVATIAGCGAAPDPNRHNNADIAFAQQMIPHHRQAVHMAELAPQRAGGQPVKQLATAIQAAQQPEIDQMTAMLKSWHAPETAQGGMPDLPGTGDDSRPDMPRPDMPGMDHGAMPGMMSDQDMAALGQAGGAAFDRQFLTMMISHHQGALTMAATELRDGVNPGAKALAQRITDSQTAQINQMRGMLAAG